MIDDNNPKASTEETHSQVGSDRRRDLDALAALLDYIQPELLEYSDRAAQLVSLARKILIEVGRLH